MHCRIAISIFFVSLLAPPALGASEYEGPIIDMHLHSYTADNYWGGRTHRNGQASPATAAEHRRQVIAEMDANSVEMAVVSGSLDSVAEFASADPRFLRGLSFDGTLPPLDEFERLLKSGEIDVFGEIGSTYFGKTLNDPMFTPYLELCEQYDVPVAYHTGGAPRQIYRVRPAFRLSLGDPFLIEDVLVRHPDLRIYLMHAGEVYYEHTVRLMVMHPQVHADLGVLLWIDPLPKSYAVDFLRRAQTAGILDRVMFGTDQMVWPGALSESVQFLNGLAFLSEQEKADIFYNNAQRFLRLDDR